jgi:hypothetical protein
MTWFRQGKISYAQRSTYHRIVYTKNTAKTTTTKHLSLFCTITLLRRGKNEKGALQRFAEALSYVTEWTAREAATEQWTMSSIFANTAVVLRSSMVIKYSEEKKPKGGA